MTLNKKVLLLHSDFYIFSCYKAAGLTPACSAFCSWETGRQKPCQLSLESFFFFFLHLWYKALRTWKEAHFLLILKRWKQVLLKISRKMTAERQSKQPKIKQSGCKDSAVNLSHTSQEAHLNHDATSTTNLGSLFVRDVHVLSVARDVDVSFRQTRTNK